MTLFHEKRYSEAVKRFNSARLAFSSGNDQLKEATALQWLWHVYRRWAYAVLEDVDPANRQARQQEIENLQILAIKHREEAKSLFQEVSKYQRWEGLICCLLEEARVDMAARTGNRQLMARLAKILEEDVVRMTLDGTESTIELQEKLQSEMGDVLARLHQNMAAIRQQLGQLADAVLDLYWAAHYARIADKSELEGSLVAEIISMGERIGHEADTVIGKLTRGDTIDPVKAVDRLMQAGYHYLYTEHFQRSGTFFVLAYATAEFVPNESLQGGLKALRRCDSELSKKLTSLGMGNELLRRISDSLEKSQVVVHSHGPQSDPYRPEKPVK